MARGKSEKLLAQLPETYSRGWLERSDRRTRVWKAATEKEATLLSDAGGADSLSHARRSLIRRAVFLELLVEGQELRLVGGEPVDVGSITQALNSLLGVYRLLGLERKAKPTRGLREVMGGAA